MTTFISAAYGNPDNTSIIALTVEVGHVALSEVDRPEQWAALHASGITISPFVPPPPPPYRLDKQTILGRLTDDEADAFEAALQAMTSRQRLLWEGTPSVASDEPYFATVQSLAVNLYGETRAAELLAEDA
jgi:hypothetical protein